METQNKGLTESKHRELTKMVRDGFLNVSRFKNVEGFLLPIEGFVLYCYALNNGDSEIVEIGSYKGKSTLYLAQGLKDSGKNMKVNAVDHFIGSLEHQTGQKYNKDLSRDPTGFSGDTYLHFRKNLSTFELMEWVNPIKMTSMQTVKDWEKPIGLIFIDGSHKYDDVRNDFIKWSQFVQVGGTIILHDTIKWPGPKAVVEELINDNEKYISYKVASMTIATKVK